MKRREGPEREIQSLEKRIAELEKSEILLRDSEAMFHALFEQAGGYSMILDPNTPDGIPLILAANRAACEHHGYCEEEFIGKPVSMIDDEEGKALVRKHTAMIMTGEPFSIENRHLRKDGTVFHVAVQAKRIDIGDNPPLILTTEYDITEKVLAREKLQESEERFRRAFVNLAIPIMIHAEDGTVLQINNKWLNLTGYTFEEIDTIEKWTSRAYGKNGPEVKEYIASLFLSGSEKKSGEFTIRKKNGEAAVWDFSSTPLGELPDGRKILITSVTDVTERVKMQAEINHAEKMTAVGQLAGGIAHDFNNQLGGILGYLELLKVKSIEDAETVRMLNQMEKCVDRAKSLTSQLLSFSRKGKILHEPFDVQQIVVDVAGILEHSINKNIRLEIQSEEGERIVSGDASQINNALLNIALNARDAMPSGGSLIFRTLLQEMSSEKIQKAGLEISPGLYALVEVSDTGDGMDQEILRHALEPFFTTKDPGKGTGMGLSAAYGAARSHKGDLLIRSEEGKGTKVGFYLPLSDKAVSRRVNGPAALEPAAGVGLVLLVDDDRAVCDVGKSMLTRLGYKVEAFLDPQEAILFFEQTWSEVQVAVIDMIMPGLSGREFYEGLRAIDPDVKVILASGYSLEGEAQSLLDSGVKSFIGKPFSMKELGHVLREVVEG